MTKHTRTKLLIAEQVKQEFPTISVDIEYHLDNGKIPDVVAHTNSGIIVCEIGYTNAEKIGIYLGMSSIKEIRWYTKAGKEILRLSPKMTHIKPVLKRKINSFPKEQLKLIKDSFIQELAERLWMLSKVRPDGLGFLCPVCLSYQPVDWMLWRHRSNGNRSSILICSWCAKRFGSVIPQYRLNRLHYKLNSSKGQHLSRLFDVWGI